MQRLDGVVRNYHWGDREAIPRMLGVDPDGRPWAELWFGAHPSAPSPVEGTHRTLDAVVAEDPSGVLGPTSTSTADLDRRPGTTGAGGDAATFPLLVKVLAIAGPLSIQVHPDTEQARSGFAAENAAGIPLDAPHRTYRDPHAKPELVCALTPFEAKCGLRPVTDTLELLGALACPALDDVTAILRDGLGGPGDGSAALREALTHLLTRPPEVVTATVDAVAAATHDDPSDDRWAAERTWTRRLAEAYPGDVGVLVALLLNHVTLRPGEAIFLGAGNLHSYLSGVAVEVMAPSDNVVRGGLTSKHVDTRELLRILDPTPVHPTVQVPAGAVHEYDVGTAPFTTTRIRLQPTGRTSLHGPGILLVTEGRAHLGAAVVSAGQAALIRADDGTVEVSGAGLAHWAGGVDA